MKTSIKKKLIAIAMASVMVGSTVSGMAVTASTVNYETVSANSSISETGAIVSEGTTSDGWKYCIEDKGTASIVKYTGNAKKVTLPISIEGKSIHYIVEGALKGTSVETLVIPDGTPLPVECSEKQLTWNAFADSPNLKEVVIGSMFAEAIPEYSFQGCSKLEKVTFTKDFSKKALEAGRCAIRTSAFEGTAIKSFVVPEGITEIRRNALASKSLVNVSFPTTIVSDIDEGTNRVDLETITGLSVKESAIKNVIARGESSLIVGISENAMVYCSNSSVMKLMCDYNNLRCTNLSTINADKMECEWLGIPYEPATTLTTTTTETKPVETTTTETSTVSTSTTETKPTETDVTETTTTIVESTTVSTTTETKPVETTTTVSSTQPTTTPKVEKNPVCVGTFTVNLYKNGLTTNYRAKDVKDVKYSTKKKGIVSVKNGIITANKAGSEYVTITNNKNKSYIRVLVKVYNPKINVKYTKTGKNKGYNIKLKKGKSFKVKVTGRVGKVTYSVIGKNKNIVKVSPTGKITASKKKTGKTWVTVKTNGMTFYIRVTVTKK